MTANDLIGAIEKLYRDCPIAARNKAQFPNRSSDADLIIVTWAELVYEFEVKLSRADFLRDKRKDKMGIYNGERGGYRPNRFWYVAPEGVISKEDLPWWAGLMIWRDGALHLISKAPPFGRGRFPTQMLLRLAKKMRDDATPLI